MIATWDPVRWLSHVWDVITEPSVDAFRPTMMEVQACSWGARAVIVKAAIIAYGRKMVINKSLLR
jgi:hypothetical protein